MFRRTGSTLLEVAMALAIFVTVLLITVESLSGIRRFVTRAAMEDGLADEAQRVLFDIAEDLSNSAWLIQVDPNNLTEMNNLANSSTYDRDGARYYPYVVVQDYATATATEPTPIPVDGMPSTDGNWWYASFKRPPAEVMTPFALASRKPNLPPDHLGLSQELIFLKVQRGPRQDDPSLLEPGWVDFQNDPQPMSGYNDVSNLEVVESLGLATRTLSFGGGGTALEVQDVPLSWEAPPGIAIWNGTEFIENNLRHYSYALVPGEPYGTRLLRVYRNEVGSNQPPTILDELSTVVDRITIDTYRTASDLSLNQIRVRLWLSRPSDDNPEIPVTHYAEAIFALRSTVDPEYSLRFTDWLGTAGDFGFGP